MQLAILALVILVSLCRALGTHRVLRWPCFLLISLLLTLDLLLYLIVRIAIRLIEYCAFARRRRERALGEATSFNEWQAAAARIDAAEGRDAWRREPQSHLYDWRHAVATTQRLRQAREAASAADVMAGLEHCLKPNFCGVLELELYARARTGTKVQIEAFAEEVCESLRWLAEAPLPKGSPLAQQRLDFVYAAQASFGASALVLSGGAMAGVYHFGIARALLQQGLLPHVVCGASAGAVVAALICCRTDEELLHVLTDESDLFREMGSHGPFSGSVMWKLQQLLKRGHIYDWREFHEHMSWFSRGFTFKEAFEYSGRALNITCTPLRSRGRRAPPLVLNHIETPNVEIGSAVCASACIPGLIDPVYLLQKAPDGTLEPFHQADELGMRIVLRDGSYECDIPLQPLAAQFGVAFSIVSQVNPHVVPFYIHPCGRPGRPSGGRERTGAWRGGFFFGGLEVALKEDMRKHLRTLQRLHLLVDLFGVDWSNVWLQQQDGSITITPELEFSDFANLLDNLRSPADLSRKLRSMERATWEAVPLIRMRMDVEAALERCAAKVRGDPEPSTEAKAPAPPKVRRATSSNRFSLDPPPAAASDKGSS